MILQNKISAMEIINLDTKVFIEKIMMAFVFKINSNNIYIAMIFDKLKYNSATLNYYTRV